MTEYTDRQVVIIGGGPAGLAAAAALYEQGVRDILILERENRLGGILNQCIHDGFGLARFGEALSGPEYAGRFADKIKEYGIEYITRCTVISLNAGKEIVADTASGLLTVKARAVILAMGCRERPRGAMAIPGDRPSGVFTAGVAQNYMNLRNKSVGRDVIILGSGDIGMIMARRLTLEGAKVHAVFEILPYPSGLPRNIEQCLHDYNIPLYLSHTVTRINGRARLESVAVSEVDERRQSIPGTETEWPCDTLILSVGLIPENELSRMAGVKLDSKTKGAVVDEYGQTSVPGIFAAGNVLHVHDLVDFVSLEAESLVRGVKAYLTSGTNCCDIELEPGENVAYTIPQKLSGTNTVTVSFRPRKPMKDTVVMAVQGGRVLSQLMCKKVLPAVMLHLTVKAEDIIGREPIRIVIEAQRIANA